MKNFEFCLTFRLASSDEDGANYLEALLESGCDDATASIGRPGRIVLDFNREAETAGDAVESAIVDSYRALPGAILLEVGPDLVNLTDLAEILDTTRQNLRKYASGEIKSVNVAFPSPTVSSEPPLWRLAEVAPWFEENTKHSVPEEIVEISKVAFHENQSIQARRVEKVSENESALPSILSVFARQIRGTSKLMIGGRALDFQRLGQAVAILADRGTPKTKLNKLMFYADFLCFRKNGQSITGLSYAAINLGPVPHLYEMVYSGLSEIGAVTYEEQIIGPYISGVIAKGPQVPSGTLSGEEVEILEKVRTHFAADSATRIVEISHEEDAWIETPRGALITYQYADRLKNGPVL
ncbi:Panacea domain-containing protein [Nitrospirillum viridazoti]|uniref:Antitoxin SocA-like Panacea domain-containing protein n=1 Tax=Nitrospirillum viridazoti CBAmc TaxID=1441467 RepID=A0A248JWZ9_9PROT|nr:Panacea domain-containing protein [Nitrospirillum amazonense]ASG23235.1 hypothetical protein Y958_20610 [Nitrospirillum amazonense CBAmc]TWB38995.1 uncharacterized protein DUF4065 [Nitrospirillum amazonense]